MSKHIKYKFNPETLVYEMHKISAKMKLSKGFVLFLLSIAVSAGYFHLYKEYFKLENPKTLLLKKDNEELANRLDLVNRRFDEAGQKLRSLQMRDNYIYRPIFGMDEIPIEVRDAGFGGVDRYAHLDNFDHSDIMSKAMYSIDLLYKKAFVQSKSFDDIAALAKNAGELTLSIPTIPPVNIASGRIRYSSSFGFRKDPFNGETRMHTGVDLSGRIGEQVYATGNGKVIDVGFDYFGYGNYVLIDHGFGYKTRYAHLKAASVSLGMEVQRGHTVGLMGNTGRSKGPHLHYEVIYRNKHVNPLNYYNRDISDEEEFMALITPKG